jgi:TM2 domain-containing membrane protein YozV
VSIFADRTIDPLPPDVPLTRRSAGRAWLLSLLVPGAGQLYCGAMWRGALTLIAFAAMVAVMLFAPGDIRWIGLRMAVMLFAFAGVDAYCTATERNAGIEPDASDNPRMAALLNLTTNGFGYVYLGWKIGFATIFLLSMAWRLTGATLPVLGETLSAAIAVHAYREGRKLRSEAYPESARLAGTPSRVPRIAPWIVSGVILGAYYLLVIVGQVVLLTQPHSS